MSRMGSEISRLRKELGLTQKQLAKLVGVTEGFIMEVEAGRKVLNSELSTKISKALRRKIGNLDIYEPDSGIYRPEPDKKVVKVVEKPVQDIWNNALAGVLISVPVLNCKMEQAAEPRLLPIIDNKVEGFARDKVLYLIIEDDEMAGYRIYKGDLAFAVSTAEIEKDSVYLVEYDGKRAIRQIKKLNNEKLLVVSNNKSLTTETVMKKDLKVIARLIRLEVML